MSWRRCDAFRTGPRSAWGTERANLVSIGIAKVGEVHPVFAEARRIFDGRPPVCDSGRMPSVSLLGGFDLHSVAGHLELPPYGCAWITNYPRKRS